MTEKILRPTTGALIIKDNKILLAKRNHEPFYDYWTTPGGWIEFGEKAEDAIKREVKEEVGLDVDVKFLTYCDEILSDRHYVALFFIATPTSTEIKIDPKEVKECKWFDIQEARKIKLAFFQNKILEKYLEVNK